MPARQNIKTVVTPVEIMGDDAWIKIKDITMAEAKEFQRLTIEMENEIQPERQKLYENYALENNLDVNALTDNQKALAVMNTDLLKRAERFYYNYFAQYVIDWNWVEADGSDMPKPHNNIEAFRNLTTAEFDFIQSLFSKEEKEIKN